MSTSATAIRFHAKLSEPLERIILSFLDFEALGQCLQASNSFNKLVCAFFSQTRTVHIEEVARASLLPPLSAALMHARNLRKLRVDDINIAVSVKLQDCLFAELIGNNPQLEDVDLPDCFAESWHDTRTLRALMQCPRLKVLSPQRLAQTEGGERHVLMRLLPYCAELTELHAYSTLSSRTYREVIEQLAHPSLRGLRLLQLMQSLTDARQFKTQIAPQLRKLPALTDLLLTVNDCARDVQIAQPKLTALYLNLQRCRGLPQLRVPALTRLTIVHDLARVPWTHLWPMLFGCPRLDTVEINSGRSSRSEADEDGADVDAKARFVNAIEDHRWRRMREFSCNAARAVMPAAFCTTVATAWQLLETVRVTLESSTSATQLRALLAGPPNLTAATLWLSDAQPDEKSSSSHARHSASEATVATCHQLQRLNLYGLDRNDIGSAFFAGLSFPALHTLYVFTSIVPQLDAIVARMPRLEELAVRACVISTAPSPPTAQLPALRVIKLRGCNSRSAMASIECMQSLVRMASRVERVLVSGSAQSAVQELTKLAPQHLRVLYLLPETSADELIDEDALASLRSACPALDTIRSLLNLGSDSEDDFD